MRHSNRISSHLAAVSASPAGLSSAAIPFGSGFALCPWVVAPGSWQMQVYQLAFERARAALEPARSRMTFEFSAN
jgi:hypothetical protein